MNVVVVSQSSNLYGSERGMLEFLTPPHPPDFDFVVVAPASGPLVELLDALGLRRVAWQFNEFSAIRRPGKALVYALRFARLLRTHGAQLLLINFEGNVPLLVLGSLLARVPIVRMLKREVRPRREKLPGYRMTQIDRWCFQRCHGVVCISRAVENQLRDAMKTDRRFPAVTLYDPQDIVSVPAEKLCAARSQFGIKEGRPVIGQFGRLHPIKGIDVLLRAAPIVLQKYPHAQFLLVGGHDGSREGQRYADSLLQLARELNVSDRITWTGFMSEPATVMACCDTTALPTRAEGLGRVILESWAVGRPVVASAVDGPADIVGQSGGGLLHVPEDPQSLAECLVKVVSNPALSDEFVRRGREWLRDHANSATYKSRLACELRRFVTSGSQVSLRASNHDAHRIA